MALGYWQLDTADDFRSMKKSIGRALAHIDVAATLSSHSRRFFQQPQALSPPTVLREDSTLRRGESGTSSQRGVDPNARVLELHSPRHIRLGEW